MLDTQIIITDKAKARLTPREQQVLELIARGAENKQIVRLLGIALGTVLAYNESLYEKTGLKGQDMNLRSALVTIAFTNGFLTTPSVEL